MGVKDDLYGLGVAGGLGTYCFVARVGNVSTGESGGARVHAIEALKNGFYAPVAASSERGECGVGTHGGLGGSGVGSS